MVFYLEKDASPNKSKQTNIQEKQMLVYKNADAERLDHGEENYFVAIAVIIGNWKTRWVCN